MILNFPDENFVYVVMGIDANEHDQVLSIFHGFERAKQYSASIMHETEYYDLWIEKHPVM